MQNEFNDMVKNRAKDIILDITYSFLAGVIVAFGLHVFSNANGFVPGGLTGVAAILSMYTPISMAYYMLLINLPLFVLVSIFVERKLGFYLTLYISVQSISLLFLEKINFYQYTAGEGSLIFAAISTGVVCGLGFALQIRRHGASGGTYAISALIKKAYPAANLAWNTFIMDAFVVFVIFIINLVNKTPIIEPTMCTLINLFIANIVLDYCLQGAKEGYKFEIITDDPEGLSKEIMEELHHGVTELTVHGMYTHQERYMIVCIIRKRELSKMMKIIKKHPQLFASFSRVNEVFGRFRK